MLDQYNQSQKCTCLAAEKKQNEKIKKFGEVFSDSLHMKISSRSIEKRRVCIFLLLLYWLRNIQIRAKASSWDLRGKENKNGQRNDTLTKIFRKKKIIVINDVIIVNYNQLE